jgi:hypothetical protein
MQPRTDVALQRTAPQNLGQRAGRLPAPQLDLEQPVARRQEPLRKKQVRLIPRIDVMRTPPVAQDLDPLTHSIAQHPIGTCHHRRCYDLDLRSARA